MAFAASTAGRDSKRSQGGEIYSVPMTASSTIYKGDQVIVAAATGLCHSITADDTTVATDKFAGVAAETKTSGASGTEYINVYVTGVFEFENAVDTLAATDIGKIMYADIAAAGDGSPHNVDSTAASAVNLAIGKLQAPITAGGTTCRVRIDGYAGFMSEATADD